jgi:hypothetical protein
LEATLLGPGPIFFEGNYAQMRLPRRVYLSWTNLYIVCQRFVFNRIPWELVAAIGMALYYVYGKPF